MKRYFANRERELEANKDEIKKELRIRLQKADQAEWLCRVAGELNDKPDVLVKKSKDTDSGSKQERELPESPQSGRNSDLDEKNQSSEEESSAEDSEDSDSDEEEPLTFKKPVSKQNKPTLKPMDRRLQSIQMGRVLDNKPKGPSNEVDDTDGLDPKKEYEDWKLREESRVQREFEQIENAENELQMKLETRRKRLKGDDA